jgi:hypothetical protein
MKTQSVTKTLLLLCLVTIAIASGRASAQTADVRRTHSIWHNPHSGIVAQVYFDGHCFSGNPPLCIRPRPYQGKLLVFAEDGRFVASVSGAIDGNFTAYLKCGTYVVVPDNPTLIDFATEVTVEFKSFVPITIVLPWDADQ